MGLKVPPYEITGCTNKDPAFYKILGPFLSRREIVAELGNPVWDDDDKEWLVAHTADGSVLGFVSTQPSGGHRTVCSLYVLPDARRDVVGSALVHRVLALWPGAELKATATPASVALFKMFGFTEQGERGKFTLMERHPE